jgi:CheY-like chemotaxis protein
MKKTRILVVDDEPGFTRLLKLVLHRYEIQEENDATRAYETALAFRPDLILIDVIMPKMDGGNLAAVYRADGLLRHVPIVFLTAVISASESGNGTKHIGGFPFLAKPVSPEDLERCIEEHLAA